MEGGGGILLNRDTSYKRDKRGVERDLPVTQTKKRRGLEEPRPNHQRRMEETVADTRFLAGTLCLYRLKQFQKFRI